MALNRVTLLCSLPHRPSPGRFHVPRQTLSPLDSHGPAARSHHPTSVYEWDDSRDRMWVGSHSTPFLLLQRWSPPPRHLGGRASSRWAPALRKGACSPSCCKREASGSQRCTFPRRIGRQASPKRNRSKDGAGIHGQPRRPPLTVTERPRATIVRAPPNQSPDLGPRWHCTSINK